MMKGKKSTVIFLVVAVVGIWGTIVYKVINKGAPHHVIEYSTPMKKDTTISQTGEYSLLLNYGDPFFPTKKKDHKKRKSLVTTTKTVKKQKPSVKWPVIKYNGCISADENIRGHFTYNGKSIILKPGDSIDDNSILKEIYKDSVLITYNHDEKWFFR